MRVSPAALTACLAAVAWCGCGKGPVYARGKLRFEADARVAAANPVTVSPLVRERPSPRRAAPSFTIATPATVNQSEFPLLAGDARAVQRFRSAPQISP